MKKSFLFLFIILFSLNFISAADCPFGLVNDTYPGSCGNYVDSNKDGICDYSQDVPTTNLIQTTQPIIKEVKEQLQTKTSYYFWQISLAAVLLYLLSVFLYKKKIYSEVTHKKIWNIFLLVSFVIVALTSFVYLFRFDFGIILPFPGNLSRAHIEMGLVMILVSIFHALWHLPYWKCYFK